ncbi:hypothetical protein [Caloranaerobacter azorensis]|uniref:Uncharacterized protein n=4 Tax=Caloranaerobacter azorensis TaxID=116090 RepID=A0A1M5R013_9FIRM|nr:hypothetical protein [Caloranaerobacter azorensis]KGG80707.1 hypothetical protein Y919_04860 [Caloranaerobacter azorensis H53214]QIB26873.1 hypothetical protein G3A45_05950 [Caloranaerobacter azorensis]SHH19734.1 hypothetical protein SAMN02745135_00013 [Caloranaerobacter azorensis DSM 13643]
MKLNNKLILTCLAVILVLTFIVFKYLNDNKAKKIFNSPISSIQLQKGIDGNLITIKEDNQINSFIKDLKFDKWKLIKNWEYKSLPEIYIFVHQNEKRYDIGFYLINKNVYCSITYKTVNRYYKVPNDVYEKIIKHF